MHMHDLRVMARYLCVQCTLITYIHTHRNGNTQTHTLTDIYTSILQINGDHFAMDVKGEQKEKLPPAKSEQNTSKEREREKKRFQSSQPFR